MINCTGVFDGRVHIPDRKDNGKCENHNPAYLGVLRIKDTAAYCQRKRNHTGLCRSSTHEWEVGSREAKWRTDRRI